MIYINGSSVDKYDEEEAKLTMMALCVYVKTTIYSYSKQMNVARMHFELCSN